MKNHNDVRISVELPDKTVNLPPMNIQDGFYGIFPYNINLGDYFLKSTNAQLLCKLKDKFVFFCHEKPVFNFDDDHDGQKRQDSIIVLNEEEADNAWLFNDQLYITKGDLFEAEDSTELCLTTFKTEERIICYPEKKEININFAPVFVNCNFTKDNKNDASSAESLLFSEYELQFEEINSDEINDLFLIIDYTGDRAELYRDGTLAADWFTTGIPWRVGLRRFNFKGHFTLRIFPVTKETYFECEIKEGYVLNGISLEAQYRKIIKTDVFK